MVCFSCILQLKYKEVYEKSKAQINMDPEAHEIRAAKEAYKNISNVSVFNGGIREYHFLFITDQSWTWHTQIFSVFSLTTRRNMKPPRTSGSGQQTDPTLSMLPRTPCNRVMWVGASSSFVWFHVFVFYNIQQCCSNFCHHWFTHRLSTSMTKRWWRAVWYLWLMTS